LIELSLTLLVQLLLISLPQEVLERRRRSIRNVLESKQFRYDIMRSTKKRAERNTKMPYISTVNEHSYRVNTGEHNQQRDITIDGTAYTIDWRFIAPLAADGKGQPNIGGRYSLIIAGKSYEIFARRMHKPDEGGSETYEITCGEQRFEVRVEDEREKALGSVKSALDSGEAQVRAPMPGLVIGVPIEVGASVVHGQTVVVLEAMKMENDLAAPRAGTIKEIKVDQGQTVNQGDILIVISAEP
jgi:biotin carboxyl carrier protein